LVIEINNFSKNLVVKTLTIKDSGVNAMILSPAKIEMTKENAYAKFSPSGIEIENPYGYFYAKLHEDQSSMFLAHMGTRKFGVTLSKHSSMQLRAKTGDYESISSFAGDGKRSSIGMSIVKEGKNIKDWFESLESIE
jgi:hypothetical protein